MTFSTAAVALLFAKRNGTLLEDDDPFCPVGGEGWYCFPETVPQKDDSILCRDGNGKLRDRRILRRIWRSATECLLILEIGEEEHVT